MLYCRFGPWAWLFLGAGKPASRVFEGTAFWDGDGLRPMTYDTLILDTLMTLWTLTLHGSLIWGMIIMTYS